MHAHASADLVGVAGLHVPCTVATDHTLVASVLAVLEEDHRYVV